MRKIYVLVLLVSLLVVSAPELLRAQSRPRRVGTKPVTGAPRGEPTAAPPARTQQQQSPAPAAPARRPTLSGNTGTTGSQPRAGGQTARETAPSGSSGQEEVGEDDVVRVNTTLVTIPVSVIDRNSRYIPDLRKQDFRIYEDGIEQDVAYFATVEKPFTVALLLDTSSSTRFKLEEIQDAAIAFVDQLRSDDRVMVVAFDDRVDVLAEPTSDRYTLRSAIRRTRTGGGTRLYDAVDLVINERFNRIEGRKAIVLFTDGVDTTSRRASYDRNVRDAEELDALIYPVQYDTYDDVGGGGSSPWPSRRSPSIIIGRWPFPFPIPLPVPGGGGRGGRGGGGSGSSRGDYARADAYLNGMASRTGGRVYRAGSLRNLTQSFSDIAEELRQQYSLGYYPKRQAQSGERRQIKVRVNRPDLVVRARDSYIYNSSGGNVATTQQRPASPPEMRKRQLNGGR